MKKHLTLLAALMLSAPALAQNAVVVNGTAIPKAKLDALVAQSGQPDTPQLRERARSMLIDRELVLQEASKRHLLQRPDVREQLEQARLGVLVGAVLDDYLQSAGAVGDDELKALYEELKTRMGTGKQYHVRHILLGTEAEAKAVIAKLKAGEDFAGLAKQLSKDTASGAEGGDLGWETADKFVPEFGQAMTKLGKGETTSAPVKTEYGYHVVRVEEIRDIVPPSFDAVKPQLIQMLAQDPNWQREKFGQMMQVLRQKARIE